MKQVLFIIIVYWRTGVFLAFIHVLMNNGTTFVPITYTKRIKNDNYKNND